jgi:UDPglucose 6-dehydrogenase
MKKAKISVIGTGYVGLIQSVGLAELGFNVNGIDIDKRKVDLLNKGISPIYEKGLDSLLKKHIGQRLSFSTSYSHIKDSDIIFLCVGTPQAEDGRANLSYLYSSIESIKENISKNDKKIIVIKSTVPVGTNKKVLSFFRDEGYNKVSVVSNPEFLREGNAVYDFFNPDRIVLGSDSKEAIKKIREIYSYFEEKGVPFVETNPETAELIKYASNSFLATKISFINELARFADEVGADIKKVSYGMGLDPRIGKYFLNAGLGYGGSCFPKDVKALIKQFEEVGLENKILSKVNEINETQVIWFLEKIKDIEEDLEGKKFAVLGLAFKPYTDDLRESRSIKLINYLLEEGSHVVAYDPVKGARENARKLFKKRSNIEIVDSEENIFRGVDGIIIATEYKEFNNYNWEEIKSYVKKPVIYDGRNVLDKDKLKKIGFIYRGVGR